MSKYSKKSLQGGFGLVEIVIGSAILGLVFVALFGFFNTALPFVRFSSEVTQVNYILDEGVEVMKLLRDKSWSANIAPLATSSTYVLNFSADEWTITTGNDVIAEKFYRTITLYDIYRDGSDDIATSGTLDPGTKKITVTVNWDSSGSTSTRALSTYITDLYAN